MGRTPCSTGTTRELADAALREQAPDAGRIDACVVRDDVQVASVEIAEGVAQHHRHAGEAEAADRDRGAVGDDGHHLEDIGANLVDHEGQPSTVRAMRDGWFIVLAPGAGSRRRP